MRERRARRDDELNALGIVPASQATMKILTDGRATRAAILAGVKWLLAGAKPKDTLVFYYAGHGSYVADTSGDEIDGRDETICPHDFATAGMIKDDDLRGLLRELPPEANLDVVFDSCHSGTATRVLGAGGAEQTLVPRFVEPPLDDAFVLDVNPSLPVRRLLRGAVGEKGAKGERGERQVVVAPLNHVLWAGCRDNQTVSETVIGGLVRGVFTCNFCKALRAAGTGIPRYKLDGIVSSAIKQMGYPQVPQLEGTAQSLKQAVFT